MSLPQGEGVNTGRYLLQGGKLWHGGMCVGRVRILVLPGVFRLSPSTVFSSGHPSSGAALTIQSRFRDSALSLEGCRRHCVEGREGKPRWK